MPKEPPNVHVRAFRSLITPTQWHALVEEGRPWSFAEGDRLIDQGAPSRTVLVLRQGRVRVVYTDEHGNEALVAVRGGGDLVGEYAQQDRSRHMASVVALERGRAAVLSASRFEQVVRRQRLEELLQRYMLGKARQVGERVWRAASLGTEQRVAHLFLEVAGAELHQEVPTVPMSQGLIASSLGLSRRSVNHQLSRWREDGVVRTQPPPIALLDLPALRRRASALE
jgi:CRP-like cAMP-binding protein